MNSPNSPNSFPPIRTRYFAFLSGKIYEATRFGKTFSLFRQMDVVIPAFASGVKNKTATRVEKTFFAL